MQPYQGTTTLAVCEATGGYEDILLGVLLELAIPAHRADPAKVKAYIKSFGKRAKNDPIDARWLSRYGRDRAATLPRWRGKRFILPACFGKTAGRAPIRRSSSSLRSPSRSCRSRPDRQRHRRHCAG
nr:transposase [Rhizobium leguminosarum]